MAQEHFPVLRFQHAFHCQLHVFDRLIDDRIKPDIHLLLFSSFPGGGVRTDIESDNDRIECGRKVYVILGYRAGSAVQHPDFHFIVAQLFHSLFDSFNGALHVCLDNQVERCNFSGFDGGEKILHAHLRHGGFTACLQLFAAFVSNLAAQVIISHRDHFIAGAGNIVKAHNFNRHGRPCFADPFALVIDQGAHFTGSQACNHTVPDVQRTVLEKNSCQRAS